MPGETKSHKVRQAVNAAEDVLLDDQSDNARVLRAVHALTQASTDYANLIEVGVLEARLSDLERSLGARQRTASRSVTSR